MIYLDNAATTFPKPSSVIKAVYNAQSFYGANPGRGGHRFSIRAGEIVFLCRERLGKMFGCKSENVAFTNNCTTALNTAINGILKKGDHVVISSLEHNSVLRPIHALSQKGIISYSVARVNPFDDNETLRSFAYNIKENTVAVIVTHVSNVFGTVLPVGKISALCKAKGILFILDAAQSAGSHRINMEKEGIDVLCVPGHKGLYGPMGTGALLFKEGLEINALTTGGTGSFSLSENQPEAYPDRLESGTLNLPGIAGLCQGISFVENYGGEGEILKKESELIKILCEDLSAVPGAHIYSGMQAGKRTNVISFNLGNLHSEMVAAKLDRSGICLRAGYHCSFLAHKTYGTTEKGTVRASVGAFNTKKDVKNLVFSLNKIAMSEKLC